MLLLYISFKRNLTNGNYSFIDQQNVCNWISNRYLHCSQRLYFQRKKKKRNRNNYESHFGPHIQHKLAHFKFVYIFRENFFSITDSLEVNLKKKPNKYYAETQKLNSISIFYTFISFSISFYSKILNDLLLIANNNFLFNFAYISFFFLKRNQRLVTRAIHFSYF